VTEGNQPAMPAQASRRTVLAGAGAVGAVGLLAACGADTPAAAPTPADPALPSEASGPDASASPTTAGDDPNVIKVTDIPVGGGKIYDNRRIVVTQPTAGTFKAFDSLCTHMGCVVTSVFAGKINCPCHMSQYSVVDGSVIQGPAPRPLAPMAVTITGDVIAVS
jgi:Rieske Fe-S protein